MKWNTRSAVVVLSLLAFSCIVHANDQKGVLVSQGVKYLSQANGDKKAINEAIQMYLAKNPPDVLSELMYSTVEKAQPASIPEAERKNALSHIKKNITPEILTKMISAGLKRNFTAEEINVLSKYDESQLSEDLKKKNNVFKFEVSSEIGLLLAATSG
jgi:hypothetical protein